MNIFITGGAGFIGANCTLHFAKNHEVTVVDNLSREGVDKNMRKIQKLHPKVKFITSDVKEIEHYKEPLSVADVVIHLAGQTAVTTSIKDPQRDFDSNLRSGFLLLEEVRKNNPGAIVLYASTNKVYGNLHHHKLEIDKKKNTLVNITSPDGIDETEQINLISPYGCSKGSLDFYMLDYARIYGLKTVVFRQSCIYGPFQMGVEDQGWVAHFAKQFLQKGGYLKIYGSGVQVRDLLYVGDLINAYELAIKHVDHCQGQAFNIGGGVANAFSLLQVVDILKKRTGRSIPIDYEPERPGDQKYFVSNNAKLKHFVKWQPITSFENGVDKLLEWQRENI